MSDQDQGECYCSRCGSSCGWVDCEMCDSGFTGHDCGEDSCCCQFPEDNVACEICGGDGGWMQCMSSEEWCRGHPLPGHENDPGKPEWIKPTEPTAGVPALGASPKA